MLGPSPELRNPLLIDSSSEVLTGLISDEKIKTKFKTRNIASKKRFQGGPEAKNTIVTSPNKRKKEN
jgi:hypothetical protein